MTFSQVINLKKTTKESTLIQNFNMKMVIVRTYSVVSVITSTMTATITSTTIAIAETEHMKMKIMANI